MENKNNTISDASFGYSMYTIPSEVPENMLKKIVKEDLFELEILPKEIKDLEYCNLSKFDLEGYYYDKDGKIYFGPGLQFCLKIKYFNKLYKNKINGL